MPRPKKSKATKNRGLFYFRTHIDDRGNLGVINKCLGIVEAFTGYGVRTDYVFFSKNGLVKNGTERYSVGMPTIKNSIGHFLLFLFLGGKKLFTIVDFEDYDFIYIRHLPTNFIFIHRLRKIRKQYPKLKVLIEIPTYPYDEESRSLFGKLILAVDKYYRRKLAPLVDLFLVDVQETEVFGVPAMYIPIGLSEDRIKDWDTSEPKVLQSKLNFVFIGNISFWHGLDRFLIGLKSYLSSNTATSFTIHVDIVGSGTELPKLKHLVKEQDLSANILFSEPMPFNALKKILDKAHLGIGTLGAHRKGLRECSSIKHRDYFGMGLPFLLSGNDPDFEHIEDAIFRLNENDEAVPLEKVINWYIETRKNKKFDKEITYFAKKNLMWSQKLLALKNYIY